MSYPLGPQVRIGYERLKRDLAAKHTDTGDYSEAKGQVR